VTITFSRRTFLYWASEPSGCHPSASWLCWLNYIHKGHV